MPTRMCAWRSWAMRWGSEPQEMKQERRKTEKEIDERKSVPAACHVHRRIICDDGGDRPVGKVAAGGVAHQLHPPYAMTCIWGIEMGKATILLHCSLVLLQIILLRRNFKPVNLLQVAVGIAFGYFTTFCNWCVSFLTEPDGIVLRVILLLLSVVCIALGIFLYMPPDIMALAGEGTIKAISDVSGMAFAKVKVLFDSSLVAISLAACLLCIGSFGSVGVGTVIAAVLVGTVLGFFTKWLGARRDCWLFGKETVRE